MNRLPDNTFARYMILSSETGLCAHRPARYDSDQTEVFTPVTRPHGRRQSAPLLAVAPDVRRYDLIG